MRKLRSRSVFKVWLWVEGSLDIREQHLHLLVDSNSWENAAKKAVNVAWKKEGCILSNIHVMTVSQETVWF